MLKPSPLVLLGVLSFCRFCTARADPLVIPLWPHAAPGTRPNSQVEGDMTTSSDHAVAGEPVIRLGNISYTNPINIRAYRGQCFPPSCTGISRRWLSHPGDEFGRDRGLPVAELDRINSDLDQISCPRTGWHSPLLPTAAGSGAGYQPSAASSPTMGHRSPNE